MNLFNYVCTYVSICDLEKKIFYLVILEKASIIQFYCCVSLFIAVYKFRFFFRSKYTCLWGFSCCFPHTGSCECYPTCFYHPNSVLSKAVQRERWNHSDNLISCLILVIGVLVMTVGFVLTLLHPQECSHGKEMFYCFSSNVSFHNSTLPP